MRKIVLVLLAVLMASVFAGVAVLFIFPYSPEQPPEADDSDATTQGIGEVVKANNEFAFDFYSSLSEKETGNLFFSPYSVSAALAITFEGARAETADEIQSVFHFPDKEILRPNFAAIYNNLNKPRDAFELRTGNALWVQEDYPFLEEFLETVERFYGGKAANLDFVNEAEKSRQTINAFIERQTNNRIKDLIPQGLLGPFTRLVITNAVYFKGNWQWQFDEAKTREMDFRITPDNIVKADMMFMEPEKAWFNYADLNDLQLLELPYKGEELSMLILLPTEDLASIEPLTAEKLSDWKNEMSETKLDAIYLPKFEFDSKYFLKEVLSEMGMPTAFSGAADFSGLDGSKNLFIDSVIHQGFVKVDEKGTEAAAATAVIIRETSAHPGPRTVFRADRPFIFLIQENETGNILFFGRVVDPTK